MHARGGSRGYIKLGHHTNNIAPKLQVNTV